MKIFQKLKAYNKDESGDSIFGFGFMRAMDYEKEKRGHLIIISLNAKVFHVIKKLFIPF